MAAPARPPTSEQRWAAAAQLASGIRDEGFATRRRRVYAILFPILGVFVVAVVLSTVLPSRLQLDLGRRVELPDWVASINLVLLAGALALMVWGFVRQYRIEGTAIETQQVALAVLSHAERRSARRQMSGSDPLDPAHRDILVAVARARQVRARASWPINIGILVLLASAMLSAGGLVITVLQGLLVLVMLIVLVALLLRFLRDGRFLRRETTEPAPE